MSVEVLPLGERCNIACTYCYQEPIRRAGNEGHPKYSLEKMKIALRKEGQPFSLFGGEPLLTPMKDLEELFKFGIEEFGEKSLSRGNWINSIQTNGTLITPEHIALFKKYHVSVGMSVDGPDELNDSRWAGDVESTRKTTANSQWALRELLKEKMSVSIITTLHRLNASSERLPRLVEWFRELSALGLRHVNLHLLQVDSKAIRENLALTPQENVDAIIAVGTLMDETPLRVMPLTDILKLLRGEDGTTCTWNACDSYTTAAVHGVDGQGNLGNCGRTCKQGPHWIKADTPGFERYIALYHTPQTYGGCSGCRFFYACKGHCPGEGREGGDWRSKTEHCETLVELFSRVEAQMVLRGEKPLSLSGKRPSIEESYLAAWMQGRTISLSAAVRGVSTTQAQEHVDTAHVDTPHVDHTDDVNPHVTHDDHNDNARGGSEQWGRL